MSSDRPNPERPSRRGKPPLVGLLGGIGSGKSTVARLFSELGAEWIDADRIAHEVLATPEVARQVAQRLGPDALTPEGKPDRKKIAERVFADPQALRFLEDLVHPAVLERIRSRIEWARKQSEAPCIVLDVPLLLETRLAGACDVLVFVDAPESVRAERVAQRGWTEEELRRREAAQAPLDEKRRCAHYTVDNSGSLDATRMQVEALFERIRAPGNPRSGKSEVSGEAQPASPADGPEA